MLKGKFSFCKDRIDHKRDFLIIVEVVFSLLFAYFVVRPFLFPSMPTNFEIYQNAYKETFGKDSELPEFLKDKSSK